jgi:hypothetical protein
MSGSENPAQPGSGELLLANSFRFTYRGKAVTFIQANIAGQPILTVGARQFYGSEVTVEATQIGDVVTVVLDSIADGDTTLLSLVLPLTRVPGFQEVDVKALAVQTTVRGTIAGPPAGAGMVYQAQEVKGRAAFIVS